MCKKAGVPMTIAHEVEVVNNRQPHFFVTAIDDYYGGNLIGKMLGIWGLSFKPNTDDIRSAPALAVISELLQRGASLIVYDPQSMKHVKNLYKDSIIYAACAQEVLDNADALLVVTEWPEFIEVPAHNFTALRDSIVFDGRLCLNGENLASVGIAYWTFGQQPLRNVPYLVGEDQSLESLSE
jgi:UDPglucose 6-dehydrogenase